jgi:hypothetical protein
MILSDLISVHAVDDVLPHFDITSGYPEGATRRGTASTNGCPDIAPPQSATIYADRSYQETPQPIAADAVGGLDRSQKIARTVRNSGRFKPTPEKRS